MKHAEGQARQVFSHGSPRQGMPSLDIVIVSWNAGTQLGECLESIAHAERSNFSLHRVVVVDNASADGSADALQGFGLPLRLIRNGQNRGFGAACNQGAQGSSADYILFLNPDTRLFSDSLSRSLDVFEKSPRDVGILGIQLVDGKDRVSRDCARFPSLAQELAKIFGLDRLLPGIFKGHFMREWDHGSTKYVDQVMGAFFLVRRDLFELLDGFDERFFVYYEEVDLSLRAAKSGFKSLFFAGCRVYHRGGGTSEQVKAIRLFYFLRSRILYGFKHFSPASALALMIATLVPEFISRLVLGAMRLSGREILETVRGYGMLWTDLPGILRTAKGGDVH